MADRMPCQVCGRGLVPLKDGTSRGHRQRRNAGGWCEGSGYRMARWPVGQLLRHHAGDVWRVNEDLGGTYGDYEIECLQGREEGRVITTHGEYMHRHGWRPATERGGKG